MFRALDTFVEVAHSAGWADDGVRRRDESGTTFEDVRIPDEPCVGLSYDVDYALVRSSAFELRGHEKDGSVLVTDAEWLPQDGGEVTLRELRSDFYAMVTDLAGGACFIEQRLEISSLEFFVIEGNASHGHFMRFRMVGDAADAIVEQVERSRSQYQSPESGRMERL